MIILLNCSFRGVNSNSNSFLERLESLFEEECERIHLNQMKNIEELTGKLKEAKALVLGMPLYVEPSGFPRRLYMLAADMSWGRNVGKNGLTKKDLYRRPD